MNPDSPSSRFDTEAAQWDSNPFRVAVSKAVTDAMVRRLSWSPTLRVMDYGAGTGLVTLRLQPLVGSLVAVDSSSNMLSELQKKATQRGLTNVETRKADLEHEAGPPAEFDLIVSSLTLHHVRDVAALLRHLRETLKPDGRIAIADLDTEDGSFHPDKTGVYHFGFDRKALCRLIESAGFTNCEALDAHTFPKPDAAGLLRQYSIFLVTARRAP